MTISRRKKKISRILDDLLLQQKLSTNKGDFVYTKFRLSKKDRKRSGWVTPKISQKGKFSEMIANAEEPTPFYDEWFNYRDGFRDLPHYGSCGNRCNICREKTEKIKKQIAIRKAIKLKNSRDRI